MCVSCIWCCYMCVMHMVFLCVCHAYGVVICVSWVWCCYVCVMRLVLLYVCLMPTHQLNLRRCELSQYLVSQVVVLLAPLERRCPLPLPPLHLPVEHAHRCRSGPLLPAGLGPLRGRGGERCRAAPRGARSRCQDTSLGMGEPSPACHEDPAPGITDDIVHFGTRPSS